MKRFMISCEGATRNFLPLYGLFIDDPVARSGGEVNGAKTTLPSDRMQPLSSREDTWSALSKLSRHSFFNFLLGRCRQVKTLRLEIKFQVE